MNQKVFALGFIAIVFIMLAGCIAGPNPQANTPDDQGHVAGVWTGLWHGIIAPVTFVISLFNPDIQMYDVNNNGSWYNLGFLLGMGVFFGALGGGFASQRYRR